MDEAPFHADVLRDGGGAPLAPGRAVWLRTDDGVRVRAAHWPGAGAGTVLLFNGRTEYVEKYGAVASALSAGGWHVVSLDWRGQGLSDRLLADPMKGHVARFADYQRDVAALAGWLGVMGLPRPWHLIGHSMGGAIGLAAMQAGLPIASAMFTGPMWAIRFPPGVRPLARAIAALRGIPAVGEAYAPTTGPESYVLTAPFEGNALTTDREMFAMMQEQAREVARFALGGPTIGWLGEALAAMAMLAAAPPPPVPALCVLGSDEAIVDAARVRRLFARWPAGRLLVREGMRHEVLMEGLAERERVLSEAMEMFARAG